MENVLKIRCGIEIMPPKSASDDQFTLFLLKSGPNANLVVFWMEPLSSKTYFSHGDAKL